MLDLYMVTILCDSIIIVLLDHWDACIGRPVIRRLSPRLTY